MSEGARGAPPAAAGPPDVTEPPAEAVGPLIRGLAVLRALARADGRLPVTDLVRATGLARSTVDRVVTTLARLGHARAEGRDVVLASGLMDLGNAYLAALRLPDLLGPHADALADLLDESVSLAVPDGDAIRFVHQATRRRAMSLTFRIGDPLPAERGATGPLFATRWGPQEWRAWRDRRASDPSDTGFPAVGPAPALGEEHFTARVEAAARDGFATDDQLLHPGLIAIAVPVRGPDGEPVCAVSVVSHTSRHDAASLRAAVLPALRAAVDTMERVLRESPAPAPGPAGAAVTGSPVPAADAGGPVFVESLARGLAVLGAFDGHRAAPMLSELAAATSLPRATVRRSLITLQHLGYVRADAGRFRPTPRVLELGFACLSRQTVARIAQPHLTALALRVNDSSSVAVLDGHDIRYVARVPTVHIMSVNITLGTRFPAFATSMGRVLLAGLPPADRAALLDGADLAPLTDRTLTDRAALAAEIDRVAREGFALVDEELEVGLRSVAVPLRDRSDRVMAAVNISTHAGRRSPRSVRDDLVPALRETAAAIEADLRRATRFLRLALE